MVKRIACLLAGLCLGAAAHAGQPELVMVAPTNHIMPIAQFQNDVMTGGIIKDLGDAIAQRLGRRARYISASAEQVPLVLAHGKADGICYVLPFWIDGDFDWSRPFMPDAEIIAAREGAPVLRSLADLRDRQIGTVVSYRYPRVEQVLGLRFMRRDAPTMEQNLNNLMAGQVDYTIIGRMSMEYQMRLNPALKLRSDLVFSTYSAQCAFIRRARVPFKDVDRAINSLIDDGSVEQILARYR